MEMVGVGPRCTSGADSRSTPARYSSLYPGGDHLLVQDGMAELPGVRAAHGRRPVAGRGIPNLGGPCMSSPPLAAGDGAAIACKIIGRKLATMTPMGVMALPEGVVEVFWQPFLMHSNSWQQFLFRRGLVLFQWRHFWRRDAPRRSGNAQSQQQIEVAGQRG